MGGGPARTKTCEDEEGRGTAAGLRPRARAWEEDLLGGVGTGQIRAAQPDLAVDQPTAGLSGVAAMSGGGGSGVEALAAAKETTGSAPGRRLAGRWPAAASGGRDGDDGKGSEGMASVRSSARRSGGRDGGGDEFTATAARATTAGRLCRVSSELDDGDKVREDGEMAAGMEGQQWLWLWRWRWRGDGVGEANLATPVADPALEESGGRDDGGDEFAATVARATMVGGLRRVLSKLDDGEKGREDGEMAAGMEGQQRLWWWRPSQR
ncbi:Os03g0368400 [Oryza sativa Japonica Group]|uniref:Os03g0368400 protein n=1 Tax=Oryza sativa subsp. japonica TaxID=39947 RepID=A0A0P0VXU5_ORYSJ|nr:Os03g0368400 [Oryza sativa Japonica Group]